jgi:serine/threonine protein kinase
MAEYTDRAGVRGELAALRGTAPSDLGRVIRCSPGMAATGPFALSAGSIFHDRYRIVRPLKAGGMGAVYEVFDQRTHATIALKVMLPEAARHAEQRARFEREAELARSVESEHVVRLFDAGVDGTTPYIAMELLRGEGLDELLLRRPVLTQAETLSFLSQIADALSKIHAAHIVHRDLKPENVFLAAQNDGSPCLKLLDFGVAKVVVDDRGKAANTRVLGTPAYMAPEQVRGDGSIGPAADLYSLAHLAYALLVGEPYWEHEATSYQSVMPLFMKILAGAEEPGSVRAKRRKGIELPVGFDGWFERATRVDPGLRFASAAEQIGALSLLLATTHRDVASGPTLAVLATATTTHRDPTPFFDEPTSAPQPEGSSAPPAQVTSPTGAGAFATQPTHHALATPHASSTLRSATAAPAPTRLEPFVHPVVLPRAAQEGVAPNVPPRSHNRARWIGALVVGVAIAGGGLLWVSGALGTGTKGRSDKKATPSERASAEDNTRPRSSSCTGALCAPIEGDAANATVEDLMRGAIALARRYDQDAKLVVVMLTGVHSRRVDAQSFSATFAIAGEVAMVSAVNGKLTLFPTRGRAQDFPPLSVPQCSFEAVWARAERQLARLDNVSVILMIQPNGRGIATWMFTAGTQHAVFRADNCEVPGSGG